MQPRHQKLLGIFAMLFSLLWGGGMYLYVIFHYHHVWSILVVAGLLFFAFVTPSVCFGYNMEDPQFFLHEGHMSEQCFLNWRDGGYVVAALLYLLTFVIPVIPWYRSDGESLVCGGVMMTHWANVWVALAYIGFLRIIVFDSYRKQSIL